MWVLSLFQIGEEEKVWKWIGSSAWKWHRWNEVRCTEVTDWADIQDVLPVLSLEYGVNLQ